MMNEKKFFYFAKRVSGRMASAFFAIGVLMTAGSAQADSEPALKVEAEPVKKKSAEVPEKGKVGKATILEMGCAHVEY